jgi:hypothetical protein
LQHWWWQACNIEIKNGIGVPDAPDTHASPNRVIRIIRVIRASRVIRIIGSVYAIRREKEIELAAWVVLGVLHYK